MRLQQKGFTMIELIVVIVILGVLAAIGVESLEALFSDVPAHVRFPALNIPAPLSELETWQEMSEPTEGGIFDVYSGSDLIGTNGIPYNKW